MSRRRGLWTRLAAIAAVGVIWWNQPYYGWNVCMTKGLMREEDFIEEMRPVFMDHQERRIARLTGGGYNFDANETEKIRTNTSRLIDALKQCVAERGRTYCRYVGAEERGGVKHQQEDNPFVNEYRHLFRYVDKSLTGYVFVAPWGGGSDGYELIIEPFHPLPGEGMVSVPVTYNSFPGFGCWVGSSEQNYWGG